MLQFRRRAAAHVAAVTIAALSVPAPTAHGDLRLSLEPLKDNTLFEYASNISNGAGAHIYAGHNFRGRRHGAIAFDVPRVPRGAQLTDASVVLHLSNPWAVRASDLFLHRFLYDWGEGTSVETSASGDGAPAQPGDATWDHAFYNRVYWGADGGDFAATPSASKAITANGYHSLSSPQLLDDIRGWITNPVSNFGWLLRSESQFSDARLRFDSRENAPTVRPRLNISYTLPGTTWTRNGGGRWHDPGNWSGGVVPGTSDFNRGEVNFLDAVAPANSPATVTIDSWVGLKTLRFAGPADYVLTGAAFDDDISLRGEDDRPAVIEAISGSHTIDARLYYASDFDAIVHKGAALTISRNIHLDSAAHVRKLGRGRLTIAGSLNLRTPSAPARLDVREGTLAADMIYGNGDVYVSPGATLAVTRDLGFTGQSPGPVRIFQLEGQATVKATFTTELTRVGNGNWPATLSTERLRVTTFTVERYARVTVRHNAPAASTIDVTSGGPSWLYVHPEAALDLTNNDLVVRATAQTRDDVREDVAGYVRSARIASAGLWRGGGITSSSADLNPLTGLAVVLNPGLATFSGEAVDTNAILVKYTYNGDANIDGKINADDYFKIDSGFLAQLATPTYANGDFNYDKKINADDYFLIDSAFLGQGQPLAGVAGWMALSAVPVPEPIAASLLPPIAAGLLLRASRGRRSTT